MPMEMQRDEEIRHLRRELESRIDIGQRLTAMIDEAIKDAAACEIAEAVLLLLDAQGVAFERIKEVEDKALFTDYINAQARRAVREMHWHCGCHRHVTGHAEQLEQFEVSPHMERARGITEEQRRTLAESAQLRAGLGSMGGLPYNPRFKERCH